MFHVEFSSKQGCIRPCEPKGFGRNLWILQFPVKTTHSAAYAYCTLRSNWSRLYLISIPMSSFKKLSTNNMLTCSTSWEQEMINLLLIWPALRVVDASIFSIFLQSCTSKWPLHTTKPTELHLLQSYPKKISHESAPARPKLNQTNRFGLAHLVPQAHSPHAHHLHSQQHMLLTSNIAKSLFSLNAEYKKYGTPHGNHID